MSETRRIQFEFSQTVMDRLDAIKRTSGRTSYAEVVRDALRLFEWFIAQDKAGYEIGLVKGEVLVKTVQFQW